MICYPFSNWQVKTALTNQQCIFYDDMREDSWWHPTANELRAWYKFQIQLYVKVFHCELSAITALNCDQAANSDRQELRSFFSPRSCCDQTEISLLHINDRGLLAVGSAASTCARCVLAAIDFGPLRACAAINSTAIKTRASTAIILIAASSQRGNSELAVSIWAILFLLGYVNWCVIQKRL